MNKDTESSFLERMPWFCQGSLGICAWISFQIQKTMIFEFSVVRFFVVLFVLTVSVTRQCTSHIDRVTMALWAILTWLSSPGLIQPLLSSKSRCEVEYYI